MNLNANFLDRGALARLPFCACGENVLIDTSVHIIGIENVSIGENVRIDANTIIIASGPVTIGSWVHIAANCYLEGRGGIRLGNFCNLSSYVSLHSVSDDFSGQSLTNPMTPEAMKQLAVGAIVLERHAAVGVKSTLLPGVRVAEGGVVGAHSLVKQNIPAWTIYAGAPARLICGRDRHVLELERRLLADVERRND